jgi:hypothetical protein
MVLVHGSWGDHENWASVVPALARRLRATFPISAMEGSPKCAISGADEHEVSNAKPEWIPISEVDTYK